MPAQEDISKIDGLVEIGSPTSNASISLVNGVVMIGVQAAALEIAKIDSFTMLTIPTVQHEHLWTDEWIMPPGAL